MSGSLKTGIFLEMKHSTKIVFILFFFHLLFSQSDERDYNEELRYQNDAINSLKTEIKQLRSKIKTAESRERSASSRISSIDEEISLTAKLIKSLKNEEEKTRKKIFQLKNEILKNETDWIYERFSVNFHQCLRWQRWIRCKFTKEFI
mgnify:CR=1 FL=1